jgi:hypothetical protein
MFQLTYIFMGSSIKYSSIPTAVCFGNTTSMLVELQTHIKIYTHSKSDGNHYVYIFIQNSSGGVHVTSIMPRYATYSADAIGIAASSPVLTIQGINNAAFYFLCTRIKRNFYWFCSRLILKIAIEVCLLDEINTFGFLNFSFFQKYRFVLFW